MGILSKAMAGAAGTLKEGFMQQHMSNIRKSEAQERDLAVDKRDAARAALDTERATILAERQEGLARLRSELGAKSGTSSTLAEMNYLNSLPEDERAAEMQSMLTLKRGGFSHGEQRYDSSGNVVVSADETAENKAMVTTATEDAKFESELENKPKISQADQNAKNASLKAKDAYEKISQLSENSRYLDQAIAEVDNGAGSGAIEKYLPSIRESSIRLDNIRTKMGLGELANFSGSTTEKELQISLDSALPDKLDGPALRKWLVDKKATLTGQIGTLSEAAKFLETGTLGEWLDVREARINSKGAPKKAGAPKILKIGRYTVEVEE